MKVTLFKISLKPSKLQKGLKCQINLWNLVDLFYFIPLAELCHRIEVIGESDADSGYAGTFELSDKRLDDAPNNPVWKKPKEDKYIFNFGDSYGWRIGSEDGLKSGGYSYKSNRFLK